MTIDPAAIQQWAQDAAHAGATAVERAFGELDPGQGDEAILRAFLLGVAHGCAIASEAVEDPC